MQLFFGLKIDPTIAVVSPSFVAYCEATICKVFHEILQTKD